MVVSMVSVLPRQLQNDSHNKKLYRQKLLIQLSLTKMMDRTGEVTDRTDEMMVRTRVMTDSASLIINSAMCRMSKRGGQE